MGSFDNERYFYLSGALSIGIFTGVIALFALVVLSSEKVTPFALVKDNYISVSIAMPTNVRPTSPSSKPSPVPQVKPPSPAETPKPVNTDVASLFSQVKTQKIVRKKDAPQQKIDNQRISAIEKRLKTVTKNQSKAASEKVRNLRLIRPADSEAGSAGSTAPEVNEYLAKIQAFVYERFYPPVGSEGSTAKIRIWLDGAGYLKDYKVLAYSRSDLFNDEVDRLKQRLNSIAFPRHPKGKPQVMDIILVAEE